MTPVLKSMAVIWDGFSSKQLMTNELGQSACFSFLFENRFGIYEDDAVRQVIGRVFPKISRRSFIFHISIVPNGIKSQTTTWNV